MIHTLGVELSKHTYIDLGVIRRSRATMVSEKESFPSYTVNESQVCFRSLTLGGFLDSGIFQHFKMLLKLSLALDPLYRHIMDERHSESYENNLRNLFSFAATKVLQQLGPLLSKISLARSNPNHLNELFLVLLGTILSVSSHWRVYQVKDVSMVYVDRINNFFADI